MQKNFFDEMIFYSHMAMFCILKIDLKRPAGERIFIVRHLRSVGLNYQKN